MVEQATILVDHRRFLMSAAAGAVALATPSILLAQEAKALRRNISSFRTHEWKDQFDALGKVIIISETTTKLLQHWTADGQMRIYPTSVRMSYELTPQGNTETVLKDEAPDWVAEPSMIERDPSLPRYMPPGPENPLGLRAMHLACRYYRIHGTNDTRKIRRKSSNGCIALYNEHIVDVFDRTPVVTQVKLI